MDLGPPISAEQRKLLENLLLRLRERAIRGGLKDPAWETAYDLDAFLRGLSQLSSLSADEWQRRAERALDVSGIHGPR